MPRTPRLGPIAACFCFALTGPLPAAPTANADMTTAPASGSDTALAEPADACRNDLETFSRQMDNDGDRVAGDGYSLGRPEGAAGFRTHGGMIGESAIQAGEASVGPGEDDGRPGVEARGPDGVALGGVDDLALNPETGKLGYLAIARGGFFGFDETRIRIARDDFRAAPNASLLALDTTKSVLDATPHVSKDAFTVSAGADGDSQKADACWKANQPAKTSP